MSRRPEAVFILSFWDCSCRDINLFQSNAFSCNLVLQYLREAQPGTPLVARFCDSPQLLWNMYWVVTVGTSEHFLGRKCSEKSLDSDSTVWMVTTGAYLYLQSKVDSCTSTEWICLTRVSVLSSQQVYMKLLRTRTKMDPQFPRCLIMQLSNSSSAIAGGKT